MPAKHEAESGIQVYHLYLTPSQFAFVLEALQSQQDNRSVDLNEIEDRKSREMVRQALAVRRAALKDLIRRMEDVPVREIEAHLQESDYNETSPDEE